MSKKLRNCYWLASLCCAAGMSALIARPFAPALPATSPQDRVNAAYAAMGGDKLKTITLRAQLQQYDPGESYSVADPAKPDTGVSGLVQSRDLQRGFARGHGSVGAYADVVAAARKVLASGN